MSCNSLSKDITSATQTTTVEAGDLLAVVRGGTLYSVSFANFQNSLGVTGQIKPLGSATAVQILNQPSSNLNYIRNISPTQGMTAAVDAYGNINLKTNLANAGSTADGSGVIVDQTAAQVKFKRIKAGSNATVTETATSITVAAGSFDELTNRVIVYTAAELTGTLDSTKEYFIDGIIDMGSQSIEIPAGGLSIVGYNFDVSKLISSAVGYTMFTSPVGGSGNIIGRDYAIEVTGATSKVYDINDATGFSAFEFSRINYNDCTSLGTIDGYRQGLEVGTGRFGGQPELELAGTWLGGYFIDTSIVRSLTDGAYTLFKAGAGFSMASRFRSNMNLDLPASASFFDFAAANFVNPSTLQIDGAIVTRDGVFDSEDANISPNIDQTALASNWMGNNGMKNTFVGGSIGITTEVATTITVANTFVDIAATLWTSADLQHFDNPAAGQLRHLGSTPLEYKVTADFLLDSTSGDDLTLRVLKWDDSASSFVTVLDQTREVNSFVGGRNLAFFNININTTLDTNDYIKLQVANVAATNNVTAEMDSYYIVEAR